MGNPGLGLIKKLTDLDTLLSTADTDDLTFLPRSLVMATLPHSNQGSKIVWERRSGNFVLKVLSAHDHGLPYGTYPRLFAMWLTNEILRTGKKHIELEGSYYAFLQALHLDTNGGVRRRFKDQVDRLLSSAISLDVQIPGHSKHQMAIIADEKNLWWDPKHPHDQTLWKTDIRVNEAFYNHVMQCSVPLDIRIVNALKKSPLALDLYAWMTYRYFYLKKETLIPWRLLSHQFGSDYTRVRDFKEKLKAYLVAVHTAYPAARFDMDDRGLTLKPSPPSIQPKLLPGW